MATVIHAYLDDLESVVAADVDPIALEVDSGAIFPRRAVEALGRAGLLGLVSAKDVGGSGEGLRAATLVVERLAQSCASTAMITCMHYSTTAVIEAYAPRAVRETIAAGRHLSTFAFSEVGSRSHFWVPLSTADAAGDGVVKLNARKSWATSAGQADSYVWSSRPLAAEGLSTLWLVLGKAGGLQFAARFDGLGLRGNASTPITAKDVEVSKSAMLGADGGGFDIMMSIVLPYFQLMNAGFSVGTMEATTAKTAAHVTKTRLQHLDQSLADQPHTRAYIARMRIKTDQAKALLQDALDAVEGSRPDAMRKILEVKAAASEASTDVTDLAMRVCGGAAFRKEVGVERHFRDSRAATVMAPTTDVLYDFIGKLECGMPLFP